MNYGYETRPATIESSTSPRGVAIVVVLAFKKNTFKTPERMIKLARSRARETE